MLVSIVSAVEELISNTCPTDQVDVLHLDLLLAISSTLVLYCFAIAEEVYRILQYKSQHLLV